jgi:hypothetical protein
LLLTENSLKVLGGFAPKVPPVHFPELPVGSSLVPSSIVPDSLNPPSVPSQQNVQVTLISTFSKQPPPISTPFPYHDNVQESKFESLPKVSSEPTPARVFDLIGSPNELKSTTPNGISQNGVHSVDVTADPFTYDLCDIDEPLQTETKPKNNFQLDPRLHIQDIFQPGRGTEPPKSRSHHEEHQVSDESLSAPSQNSSISPFKMSPTEISKYPKPSSRSMFQDLSDSPNIQRHQRLFILDILRNPPSLNTYYVEGSTIGIDALKVEDDPISKQPFFYVIVQFEEIENSSTVRVDSNLCREILNLAPDDYRVMLEKLSSKKERKQFKLNLCTKLGELLNGKFIFQRNQSTGLPYVGTILSFLTE